VGAVTTTSSEPFGDTVPMFGEMEALVTSELLDHVSIAVVLEASEVSFVEVREHELVPDAAAGVAEEGDEGLPPPINLPSTCPRMPLSWLRAEESTPLPPAVFARHVFACGHTPIVGLPVS